MRFEEAFEGWCAGCLTQDDAVRILGVCDRTFRRYMARYEVEGLDGWIGRRLNQMFNCLAPADEVLALTEGYRQRHRGWNVRHFHSWYRKDGGTRSYTWVKNRLQEAALVTG